MATPVTKRCPVWLARVDADDPTVHPNYRRSARYYRQLYQAWPDWARDHPGFRAIRAEWRRRRRAGEDVEQDHTVPILHPLVCGLHVPWNLQIIGAGPNRRKSNHWWPDCPIQCLDLFTGETPGYMHPVEPHQRALL